MSTTKADIFAQLQKDILPLQGFKPILNGSVIGAELGPVKDAFPNSSFPLGAVHEFCYTGLENAAATGGFIAGVLATLMREGGATLWISASRTIFPPALKPFGIAPDKIIFVDLQKERDISWAMEEALKCSGLAAVVGEMQELNFTTSRRLQLAVEQSRVTGFILRRHLRLNTTACVTRWQITSLPSEVENELPGVGFPRWEVKLLKVRNGKPGTWQMEWRDGKFQPVYGFASLIHTPQKKAG
jgi:protein ImuA